MVVIDAEYRARRAAQAREWRARNRERAREIDRECYYRNHEVRKVLLRWKSRLLRLDPEWHAKDKLRVRLNRAHERSGKSKLAQYYWEEIAAIYRACPEGQEVDHIHPLRVMVGREHIACGLHVPWNLQYLSVSANRRKKGIEE